jgi:hypothetical protein
LISTPVEVKAQKLQKTWKVKWESIAQNVNSVNFLVSELDEVRQEIKNNLKH